MEPNRTDLTKEEIVKTLKKHWTERSDDPYYSESEVLKAMESYSEQKEKPLLERIKRLESQLRTDHGTILMAYKIIHDTNRSFEFENDLTELRTEMKNILEVLNTKS